MIPVVNQEIKIYQNLINR